ncbi:MAG: calcium-binding protein, partial [Cyanobacteriota bacterium]|nr:calcium-binding protein [Cyanobacteriota bacterium]
MPTSTLGLPALLAHWWAQLQAWAADGSFSHAAQEALVLAEEPAALASLRQRLAAGVMGDLPAVELLPAEAMAGARGAYAASSGTIYLNATWLAGAEALAVQAVLTEELGHHLDALLNSSDTPGDEGALFAALLMGQTLSAAQLAALRAEDDRGVVQMNGVGVAVEMDNITGTEGSDNLVGTAGDDSISGLGGDDQLYGMGANDTLDGGAGNDHLDPGSGIDVVIGGDGTDFLFADRTATITSFKARFFSTLSATPLADGITLAVQGVENVLVMAGSSNDDLNFSAASATGVLSLYGGTGDDYIAGGAGNDANTYFGDYYGLGRRGGLYGGDGNDTLDGGAGNDHLDPGSGIDVVIGGDGTDFLFADRTASITSFKARFFSTLSATPLADGITLAVQGVENVLVMA